MRRSPGEVGKNIGHVNRWAQEARGIATTVVGALDSGHICKVDASTYPEGKQVDQGYIPPRCCEQGMIGRDPETLKTQEGENGHGN